MKKAIVVLRKSWKNPYVREYLKDYDSVVIYKSEKNIRYHKPVDYFFWANDIHNDFVAKYRHESNFFFFEDGFIRSSGLGADHIRPLSLVFDSQGIYYDSSCASDLESIISHYELTPDEYERARALKTLLIEHRVNKYNIDLSIKPTIESNGQKTILVVGQVESDHSILRGASLVQTNEKLLALVRENNPQSFIIYKPHPDTLVSARPGAVKEDCFYDQLVEKGSILDIFGQVDEVHTITSLAGFEALLRDIPVFTYGMPFYAGWGLTHDHYTCSRRERRIDLETLLFCALVKYPVYAGNDGQPCEVEEIIHLISKEDHQVSFSTKLLRTKRNFLKFLGFKF